MPGRAKVLMSSLREERAHDKLAGLEVGPLPVPWPLIHGGDYIAVSVDLKVLQVFRRRSLELVFELQGGRFDGVRLPWYCPLPPKGGRPCRSSYFYRAWLMVMGHDLKRGERASAEFLVGKMFRVRVQTVSKDHHGDPLPEVAKYSRISRLLERL